MRLSFCIPTYNRADNLDQLLEAIVQQQPQQTEIVISDNASADHTQEVVRKWQGLFPHIAYHRNEENLGFDRNLAKAMSIAQGEYCWFVGDDDAPKPGSIAQMLRHIEESPADIHLCCRTECDVELRPYEDSSWFRPQDCPPGNLFSFPRDFKRYLFLATRFDALFGYLSILVVRRASWEAALSGVEEMMGSAYSYTYVLFKALQKGGILHYIPKALVYHRGGQDSFDKRNNRAARVNLDVEGYLLLANKLFRGEARKLFLDAVARVFASTHLKSVKGVAAIKRRSQNQDWNRLVKNIGQLFGYRSDVAFVDHMPYFVVKACLFPVKVAKMVRKLAKR